MRKVYPPLPRRAEGIAKVAVLARGLAVVARCAQRLQVARDVVTGKEIAIREGIDNSYVSRMVNLTTLAPDIVAAILDDELPNHVTLFDLAVDPPALWDEQRSRFVRVDRRPSKHLEILSPSVTPCDPLQPLDFPATQWPVSG